MNGTEIASVVETLWSDLVAVTRWLVDATVEVAGFLVSMGVPAPLAWGVLILGWLWATRPVWGVLPLFGYLGHARVLDDAHRDPTRLFPSAMSHRVRRRVGNRCEHRMGPGGMIRCRRRRSLQADHWFPHSKGGATVEDNLVMLCPEHNRRKSNRNPSRWQTFRLAVARKSYMDHPVRPGRWYR